MPNISTVADSVNVSTVAEAFNALEALGADAKAKREFLVKAFNTLQGWEAKEKMKQEAFIQPRLKRGSPPKAVNKAWSEFMKACDEDGLMLARWTIDSAEAVRKREARKTAATNKPQAVLEAEARLKAEREKAEAEAKAQREARKQVKEKLAEAIKKMSDRELEKLCHYALKMLEPAKPAAK